MCCGDEGYDEEDVNGVCPECGGDTIDGESVDYCSYSPEVCETCNAQPCDGSC